jgi:hypothetical protein
MKLVDMDRSDLIEVNPSHDGIIFLFKQNAHLYFTDSYMPASSKELMKNTANSFVTANLAFDLANYAKPVVAEAGA